MSLDLHPSARKRFNEIAESLVEMVQLHPELDGGSTTGPASLEESLQPEIKEADVEERGNEGKVDGLTGEEVARYFRLDGDRFRLAGEEYKEFDDLVDRVADRKEIKDKVSRQYIRDKTFEWIEKKYTGVYSRLQLELTRFCRHRAAFMPQRVIVGFQARGRPASSVPLVTGWRLSWVRFGKDLRSSA